MLEQGKTKKKRGGDQYRKYNRSNPCATCKFKYWDLSEEGGKHGYYHHIVGKHLGQGVQQGLHNSTALVQVHDQVVWQRQKWLLDV